MPLVLSSRYGDIARSLESLESVHAGATPSPTSFAMSVHNGIGAMISILRDDPAPVTSLAASAGGAIAAMIEAAACLADGADEVVVMRYDEPLPGHYACFADEPQALYAWAWRVATAEPDEPAVRLAPAATANANGDAAGRLPADLALFARFLRGGGEHIQLDAGESAWRWHFEAGCA